MYPGGLVFHGINRTWGYRLCRYYFVKVYYNHFCFWAPVMRRVLQYHCYLPAWKSICLSFRFFDKFLSLVFLGNNRKWKLILLLFHLPVSFLAKFWFSSYGPKYYQPIKLHDFLKCDITRKKSMMKFISGMQLNIKVFHKLILSIWVSVTRHAQSTQNKKFTYLCNISRKAWGWSWCFACR